MSRVVVIGAGVGGLAAAARLATQGHDVTVCEASTGVTCTLEAPYRTSACSRVSPRSMRPSRVHRGG